MQGTKSLTEGVISRRLFSLTMPIMDTSFIQMAYSITDVARVGRSGSEAIAAIGAVGILTWMTNSAPYLGKVGSEVSIGQSIRVQNMEDARGFASHSLTIALVPSLCRGLLLFILAHPIIGFCRLEETVALDTAEYLRIIASAFPSIPLSTAFTGIHGAAGLGKVPFYISGTGLLLDMILGPLFILGLHLSTAGAAWATWISQAVVCGLFVYQLRCHNKLSGGFPFSVHLKERYTKRIFQLGLPVALLNAFFAVINLFVTHTAPTCGRHIDLMALTASGQMETIAQSTSQGFSTALPAFTV